MPVGALVNARASLKGRMVQLYISAAAKTPQRLCIAVSRPVICGRGSVAHQSTSRFAAPYRLRFCKKSCVHYTQCQVSSTQQPSEKLQSPPQQQTRPEPLVSREIDSAIDDAVDRCLTDTKLDIGQQTVVSVKLDGVVAARVAATTAISSW